MSAASLPLTADGPHRPVGDYGGRSVTATEIRILDVSIPAILRIDRITLRPSSLPLSGADIPLDPYGFAQPGDGTLWILGGRGRFVSRFSEKTGGLVETRSLSDPGQGIATLWDRVGIVAVRIRPGERLLLRQENGGFLPFSALLSRPAPEITVQLIRNLLRCGSGTANAIPLWYTAGPAEVFLLERNGRTRKVRVPTFATPSESSEPNPEPGAAYTFPVRDAFLEKDRLWILSNQEGDRTPLQSGALRGRHAVLLRAGRPKRVVALDREARALLDADERSVVVLFADGAVSRVRLR
ncbi:MAG TPA: hypothetical protein VGK86_07220 [Thermoanaerobaculia bacterium]|jgi:hypothetical protein